jgi:uncharacterized protein (TIGR03437 family)
MQSLPTTSARARRVGLLTLLLLLLAAGLVMRRTLLVPAHAQGVVAASADAPVADFNGDGILDFAYINGGEAGTVAVRLGNGDGTTWLAAQYLVGSYIYAVRKGDFDNDGKFDLAVAHQKPGSNDGFMTILVGRGDGTFTPRAAGAGGLFVVGDFNNDGRADLAYAGVTMLGRGDATFTPSQQSPFARDIVRDIAAGDFNGDGKLDFALGANAKVISYLGRGDGTFGQPAASDLDVAAGAVYDLRAADFDGDGRLDLAATRNACKATCTSSIAVFLNTTTAANPAATPIPQPNPTPTPTPPAITYTIRGRVTDAAGRGVRLVDVTLAGAQAATKKSDVGGNFQFTGLPRGSYTVTVGGAGYNYSPRSQAVSDLNGDAVLNFTALPAQQMVTVASPTYEQGELAFEAIASLFGAHLSTATDVATSQPLPTTLGGSTVTVRDSQGAERPAPLFFVSPTQINYQIPVGTAVGVATVYATNSSGVASACQVTISQVRPGFFSADSSGTGWAVADIQRVKADGSQVYERFMQYNPARNEVLPAAIDLGPEGEQVYLVLYGTGLRFRTHISQVTARIGSQAASVGYAGPQPQFAGLDQVNLLIPRATKGAGEVEVALSFDGKAANTVKVKIK